MYRAGEGIYRAVEGMYRAGEGIKNSINFAKTTPINKH